MQKGPVVLCGIFNSHKVSDDYNRSCKANH